MTKDRVSVAPDVTLAVFDGDPDATLCIGWDVGGWHGSKDGLAALALTTAGEIVRVGEADRHGLGPVVASGAFGVDYLLGYLGLLRHDFRFTRIVIGVDAPLGLPELFLATSAAPLRNMPRIPRAPERVLDSRLAYRDTEREIYRLFHDAKGSGWRPLSGTFDSFGSNLSKARIGAAALRTDASWGVVKVLPFDEDLGTIAVIEVYPALWDAAPATDWSEQLLRTVKALDALAPNAPDIRDGFRCALAAACYERTRRDGPPWLPTVALPPENSRVTSEGWIYAPLPRADALTNRRRPALGLP